MITTWLLKTLRSIFKHKSLFIITFLSILTLLSKQSVNASINERAKLQLQQSASRSTSNQLYPTIKQATIAKYALYFLKQQAYTKIPLDKETSIRLFNAYVDALDPSHHLFLQSDIQKFNSEKLHLLSDLEESRLQNFFDIYLIFKKRYFEYIDHQLGLAKSGLEKISLDTDDSLPLNNNKAFPVDQSKQHQLWTKELTNTTINMMLSGKINRKEISQQIIDKCNEQKKQVSLIDSDDVFDIFMNAFTMLYDPHTQYFSALQSENFKIELKLELEGIGVTLQQDEGGVKINDILIEGPAYKDGRLKVGDRIIAVAQGNDGPFKYLAGMRFSDIIKLTRGSKGSTVRLRVLTGKFKSITKEYSLVRDKIKLEDLAVKSSILNYSNNGHNYKIGVIRIPMFYVDFEAAETQQAEYNSTTKDVVKEVKALKKQGVDGMVIDIRDNGGGSLEEAVNLLNTFIPKRTAVFIKVSNKKSGEALKGSSSMTYSGPLVVMVNRKSASASEIFAAGIQDYNRGMIVGSQTYGKGTVQSLIQLLDAQLKLTFAKFYRVSGSSTQNRGVIPDIIFPEIDDKDEIGESLLPNAMKYDKINTPKFTPYKSLKPYISQIKNNTIDSLSDPYFEYIKEIKKLQKNYYDRHKNLSLNYEVRKHAFNQYKNQTLLLENKLRKAQHKSAFRSYEEMEEEISKSRVRNKNIKTEDDAYLKHTVKILSEYIELKKRGSTTTLEPKNKKKQLQDSHIKMAS